MYTGNDNRNGTNAEKNAAAFAEMTRIKALAPNLSIYYRPHAEPGMAVAPWVEFVKDITRNLNSEYRIEGLKEVNFSNSLESNNSDADNCGYSFRSLIRGLRSPDWTSS